MQRTRQWSAVLPTVPSLLMIAPLVVMALLFIVYPLVKLGVDSFTGGSGGFSNYAAAFGSPAIRNGLLTTLVMSLTVTALCLVLGGSLAWQLAKAQKPVAKALLWTAVLLPFWMGVVVKSYAWAVLLSKNGLVNTVLLQFGFVDEPLPLLYTPLAVVLGMTYTMLPYAVLAMFPTMVNFDKELLNSASVLGSSRTWAMVSVWLPLVRSGAVAAGAIVFAISIGFYITPVLLGGAQSPFMATVIGDDIFSYFNYPRAAASSVILLLTALVVLLVTFRFVGAKALRQGIGK
ncbi:MULTISPECIES: ABC transporter permease [unclassified Pseudarthrobacter]|uniref:ABC transporter permease n=1 Tax=unclassified Pseudarthrobacter TaxID=2647000 RepID=UPI0030772A21